MTHSSPTLRSSDLDKVDPLGRPPNKYNLAIRSRANELRHPPPRRFISQRHIGRAGVDAAMDRRIIHAIGAGNGVNHLLRLLRCRGGIEIVPVGNTREVRAPDRKSAV